MNRKYRRWRRDDSALIPVDHPLAAVHGAMNAEFIEGDKSDPLMWLGHGAGGEPTPTVVLGDVSHAARNRVAGRHDVPFDNRLTSWTFASRRTSST